MYKKLFNINALHSYYKDGICKNIDIAPTSECLKKIKNHKLIFKQIGNGFKIAYKTIDELGTPLIEVSGLFTFIISLKDAGELLNITNLSVGLQEFNSCKVIYFANDPVDVKTITHSFIDYIKPKAFNYQFPFKADDPSSDVAKLEVLNMDGTSVLGPFTSIKADKDSFYYKKIDLSSYPTGKYKFKVSDSNNDERDELIYVDNELSKQSIFGLLEIEYNSDSLDEYDMGFVRQESYWKYFIVNKSGSVDLDSYSVDVVNTATENPSPYDENYEFEKGEEPDPDIKVNGYDTVVFTSESKIPFYEDPLPNIELIRTDKGTTTDEVTLIKNLPNPRPSGIINKNSESEIYVFI